MIATLMELSITLTIALTIVLIFFGTIIYLCYLIFRIGLIGRVIVLAFSVWFIFSIYASIFPFDDFYKGEFVRVTGLKFPASGRILEKYASYPDMHGDYDSCALIQVSESDYESLKKNLKSAGAREEVLFTWTCNGSNNYGLDAKFHYLDSPKGFRGETKTWGILKGSNIVYIYYSNY